MDFVASGDRVQILCASQLDDGTPCESAVQRDKAYWIRAIQGANAERATQAVIGMQVGEHKVFTTARAVGTVTTSFEVVAIRKAGASK